MSITLKANAKLNLTLNVQGMYNQQYHRLSSVVTTVDISDIVTVEPRSDDKVLVQTNGQVDTLNVANSVAAAIVQLYNTKGVTITVDKGIAVMGGMGGSSVDAAATICAMMQMYDLPLDGKMMTLAAQYGSDIAYMIRGGLALASGKGDDVMFVANDNIYDFVVITGAKMSTTQVFAEYDRLPDLTSYDNDALLDALSKRNIDHARKLLGNDLQAAAIRLYPQSAEIINVCNKVGAPTPTMTGSGGNFFILCKNAKEASFYANKLSVEGLKAVACKTVSLGLEQL